MFVRRTSIILLLVTVCYCHKINNTGMASRKEQNPSEITTTENQKGSKPDPFGIMTLANRVGRAAGGMFGDYSVENDKDRRDDDHGTFKSRKESERHENEEDINKSVEVEKTVKRKEHIQADSQSRASSSTREASRGERKLQETSRTDHRNGSRRDESSRRKSEEDERRHVDVDRKSSRQDRRHFDENRSSHRQDRRQYQEGERRKSSNSRQDRLGSNPPRGNPRRRAGDKNPNRGRFIHRIVVTNKIICPNCTCAPAHGPNTHNQPTNTNTNPYYYY